MVKAKAKAHYTVDMIMLKLMISAATAARPETSQIEAAAWS